MRLFGSCVGVKEREHGFRMLIGTSLPPPPQTIALPVAAHFDLLLDMFKTRVVGSGWWRSAVIQVPHSGTNITTELLAVNVPPGIAAADLCVVLSPWRSRIQLIGFGGGVAHDLSLGDLVVASRVALGNGKKISVSMSPQLSGLRKVVVGFAPLLMDQTSFWVRQQMRDGVDVLDMETVPMAAVARRYRVAFESALVISDMPQRIPLHAVSGDAWDKASLAINRLLRMATGNDNWSPG